MNRTQFDEIVNALPAFANQATAALEKFRLAQAPERLQWPDEEATRWATNKEQRGERFTRSELNEIRDQAQRQVGTEQKDALLALRVSIEVAEEKAAAVESHAETLRPDWVDVPVAVGDYTRGMLRMSDEFAARGIRAQLTGASARAQALRYVQAVEQGDRIAMRVIEAAHGRNPEPLPMARPDDEDIHALFLLNRAIAAQRRARHPEAVQALRTTLATVKADPRWKQLHSPTTIAAFESAARFIA